MRATVFAEAGCSEEFDKAWWQRKRKYEAGHPTDHGQLLRHRNFTEWCKIWVPDSVWKCLAIFLLSWLIWVIWAIAGSSWIEKKNASAPDSLNFGEISSVAWASEQTIPVDLQRIKVCWSDCYGCYGNECKEAANQQLVWQAFSASVINLFVFSRCACVWGVRYFQDGVQPKCVCVAFQSGLCTVFVLTFLTWPLSFFLQQTNGCCFGMFWIVYKHRNSAVRSSEDRNCERDVYLIWLDMPQMLLFAEIQVGWRVKLARSVSRSWKIWRTS